MARADARTYIAHRARHLTLLRDGHTVWRSSLAHGSDNVAIARDAIAFTAYSHYHPEIWMAHLDGRERLVARRENLLGAARTGGFFTQRGHEIRVRHADGRLRPRLAVVYSFTYDSRTDTIVGMTDDDELIRTDGRRVWRLARLRRIGHAWPSWLEVLPNGLIDIEWRQNRLFLRPDGKPFASAALSRRARTVSSAVALPFRRGVVFAVRRGGSDRVLLLERGHRVPRILFERHGGSVGCGYGVGLSLVRNQLLVSRSDERTLVVLDPSGERPARDLWPIVHRIPGFRGHGRIHRVGWAPHWND